jgi:hypothetical protein
MIDEMKNFQALLLAFALVLFFSCTSPQARKIPQNFDYGKIEKNKYTNAYFNLEITLPDSWYIQSKSENDTLMAEGMDLMKKNKEEAKKSLEIAKITTANLLTLFRYKPGTNATYDHSFILLAENLGNNGILRTAEDYLKATRTQLASTQLKYYFLQEDYPEINIAGKHFKALRTRLEYEGTNIYQNYYTSVQHGFALSFIISWVGLEQKNELEKIISSAVFKE